MLLHYIMRLGSDEDVSRPSSFYFSRISTTTDPTSDKCGLPVKIGTGKKEDALNGEHAFHAYFMICKQGVDCTTRHQDLLVIGVLQVLFRHRDPPTPMVILVPIYVVKKCNFSDLKKMDDLVEVCSKLP